jgi:prophage tail gpP-like protein
MANPQEICKVTALGQSYDTWETVEVHHNKEQVIDHCMLTVSEISSASSWSTLKLKPGDPAQVYLAGSLVLDGHVYLRQATIDPNSHEVQIGIASRAQPIVPSTVQAKPGIYKNQTIQAIGSAVFAPYGVNFSVVGSPGGADLPFPRIIEQVGESCFGFIERLCRVRNLHMIDDGQGGIKAFRGPQGSGPELREGVNIQRGRILLRNDESKDFLNGVSQTSRQTSADQSRDISATGQITSMFGTSSGMPQRLMKFITEDAVDRQSVVMRVGHEADRIAYDEVDGVITVPGWLDQGGSLWWNHVTKTTTVYSPLLLPGDTMVFFIKGVIHRQNNVDGTTTDIQLTRQDGMGAYPDALPSASDTGS